MKKTYKKISQATAKKLFEEGHDIVIIPCLCNPASKNWQATTKYNINNIYLNVKKFNTLIKNIKIAFCNKYTGMRLAFYQEEASHE